MSGSANGVLRPTVAITCLTAAALLPRSATAGNGVLPRTPVLHVDEACVTRVDLTAAPTIGLAYTIPFADTCRGVDELPDSRTHQMFAWCRGTVPGEALPHWIDQDDVTRATMAGLVGDPGPTAEDILATRTDWEGCWTRVIPDEARRDIDCASALPGMNWRPADLAPGAWVIAGYVFDPPLNAWFPRRGVYKVHAGDPDAIPAVGLVRHPTVVGSDSPLPLDVCVDAAPGAVVTLRWTATSAVVWTDAMSFVADAVATYPVEVMIPVTAPTEVALRLVVEDSAGRTATYDAPDRVTVIPGVREAEGGEAPSHDWCRDDPEALIAQSCTPGEEPGDSGCRCRAGAPARAVPAWVALALALAGRGRRRVL